VLQPPVVLNDKDPVPAAVLPHPVVLLSKESNPVAVFPVPMVLSASARYPTAVLKHPASTLLRRAKAPTATEGIRLLVMLAREQYPIAVLHSLAMLAFEEKAPTEVLNLPVVIKLPD
jgi:hypothetical protein